MRSIRPLSALVASLLLSTLALSGPAHAAPVEDYASYDGEGRCVRVAKPGTQFLSAWLVRQYPGTARGGLLRECIPGSSSEHQKGRALDWTVSVTNPTQKAQVTAFLDRIFAPNRAGEPHAVARRMGIMYLIWNDRSWASYRRFEKSDYLSSSCKDVDSCNVTLRHRDHVHISLSRDGARALTSFYTARNVGSPTG